MGLPRSARAFTPDAWRGPCPWAPCTDPPLLPCSTLKLWDYSKGKVRDFSKGLLRVLGSGRTAQSVTVALAWCRCAHDAG